MNDDLTPISAYFFDDPGPHVVRAGFPTAAGSPKYTPARGQELRQLLDASIAQLGGVSGETRRKTPVAVPLPPPVAIETLLYRGPRALERALELREEFVESGALPDADTVRELFDLIQLATSE